MRCRARRAEVARWARAGGAHRAYLGLFAQLLTSQFAQQVTTQILTLGTGHEGGRAGPESAQALGPGFPARGSHGPAPRSLQRSEGRSGPRPPEGARAPVRTPKGPPSPQGRLVNPSRPLPRADASGDPAPGPRDETERFRGRHHSGQPRVPAGQGRRRGVRAESSLGRPPAADTETTAPPRPPAPAVTGRPLSPRLTQPRRALGPAGSFRAAARGGAGPAARGRRGRGRNGAAAFPPAPPAGADSPVSLGLSNCPAARGPPFPETASGPGRGGGVGWARAPGCRGPVRARTAIPGPSGGQRPPRPRWQSARPPPAPGRSAPCGGRGVRVSGLPRCPLGGVRGAVPERPQEVLLAAPAEPVWRAPQGLASLLRRRPGPPPAGLGGAEPAPGSPRAETADLCLRPYQ